MSNARKRFALRQ